jgi:hypothetical protein
MPKYPKQLQIKVDKKTVQQIRAISKFHRRTMSDMVRLLIEREACKPSDPASLLACESEPLNDKVEVKG